MLNLTKVLLTFGILCLFLQNRPNGVKAEDSSENYVQSQSDEDYWSWASSEELECSEEEFWHIRGRRCVPYICPRGNSKRNFETGECLYSSDEEDSNGNQAPTQMDVLKASIDDITLSENSHWTPFKLLMGFSNPNKGYSKQALSFKKMYGVRDAKVGKFMGETETGSGSRDRYWSKVLARRERFLNNKEAQV